jgi:O-antigen ligase
MRPNRAAGVLWALLGLPPLLLPFSRSAELPVLVGALIGGAALLRGPLPDGAGRDVVLASAWYTLAAAISAVDAVNPVRSLETALATIRLGLYVLGVAVLAQRLRDQSTEGPLAWSWVAALIPAAGLALWTADALVQAVTGWSLGGPAEADRLSGIFGADDLKLGPLLGALAPLLLWPLIDGPRWRLGLAWLAVLLVVLLAGARAGWVSYALVTLLLAWRIAGASLRRLLAILGAALLLTGTVGLAAYQHSERFAARVERTLAAGGGDLERALAGRDWIWLAALDMVREHPINGVGVRGFRHAYAAHSLAGDPWVDPVTGIGAAHAHQIVLEVLSETGTIGLLLWLLAAHRLWRVARRLPAAAAVRAPFVALGVLAFPLNTHLAFYSTFMGLVLAWLLALCVAQAVLIAREERHGA